MRLPQTPWPDTDSARGVLFFAQHMREMLSPSSFESFRALSLDTLARLREAIEVTGDVIANRIPRAALDPVLQEILWSSSLDPAAQSLLGGEMKAIKATISDKSSSLHSIGEHLYHFDHKIRDRYKYTIENYILESFSNSNDRVRLRTCTGIYCSHLLNMGYSRSYISDKIEHTFFSHPVLRAGRGTLSRFFNSLDGNKRKYSTYVAINPQFAHHLRNMGFRVEKSINSLPAHVQNDLKKNPLKYSKDFIAETLEGRDPYTILHDINRTIQNIKSLALASDQGHEFDWDRKIYASPIRSSYGQFYEKFDVVHHRSRRTTRISSTARSRKSTREYSVKAMFNFENQSSRKLVRSIDMAISSESSSEMDNRLVSYWSAIETLISNPEATGPRISHYIGILTPAICLNYPKRIMSACYDELVSSYKRPLERLVSNSNTSGTDQHSTFATILLLPELQDARDDLMKIISNNPLALHRIWKIADDFGDPSRFRTSVCAHEERVKWQIGRIYRARNSIVHAGYTPPYIDSITLNLIDYFRSVVGLIIDRAESENDKSNSDHILAALGIRYRANIMELHDQGKKATWTRENLLSMIGP